MHCHGFASFAWLHGMPLLPATCGFGVGATVTTTVMDGHTQWAGIISCEA